MSQEEGRQKSELEIILEKKAFKKEGLTPREIKRARELIDNPQYSGINCIACERFERNNANSIVYRAIYDTGMCQGHARYMLEL
jgi:hypothetical protein